MTHVELGNYGAKRQSFDRNNPRDLLVRVIEENQGADEAKLLKAFTDALEEEPDYLPAVIGYWFANNYRSLVPPSPAAKRQRVAQKQARAKHVAMIKQRILAISLDFVLPNGRALRDSTGLECQKAGGWLAKIGKAAGKRTVGAVFKDDAALQKAMKA